MRIKTQQTETAFIGRFLGRKKKTEEKPQSLAAKLTAFRQSLNPSLGVLKLMGGVEAALNELRNFTPSIYKADYLDKIQRLSRDLAVKHGVHGEGVKGQAALDALTQFIESQNAESVTDAESLDRLSELRSLVLAAQDLKEYVTALKGLAERAMAPIDQARKKEIIESDEMGRGLGRWGARLVAFANEAWDELNRTNGLLAKLPDPLFSISIPQKATPRLVKTAPAPIAGTPVAVNTPAVGAPVPVPAAVTHAPEAITPAPAALAPATAPPPAALPAPAAQPVSVGLPPPADKQPILAAPQAQQQGPSTMLLPAGPGGTAAPGGAYTTHDAHRHNRVTTLVVSGNEVDNDPDKTSEHFADLEMVRESFELSVALIRKLRTQGRRLTKADMEKVKRAGLELPIAFNDFSFLLRLTPTAEWELRNRTNAPEGAKFDPSARINISSDIDESGHGSILGVIELIFDPEMKESPVQQAIDLLTINDSRGAEKVRAGLVYALNLNRARRSNPAEHKSQRDERVKKRMAFHALLQRFISTQLRSFDLIMKTVGGTAVQPRGALTSKQMYDKLFGRSWKVPDPVAGVARAKTTSYSVFTVEGAAHLVASFLDNAGLDTSASGRPPDTFISEGDKVRLAKMAPYVYAKITDWLLNPGSARNTGTELPKKLLQVWAKLQKDSHFELALVQGASAIDRAKYAIEQEIRKDRNLRMQAKPAPKGGAKKSKKPARSKARATAKPRAKTKARAPARKLPVKSRTKTPAQKVASKIKKMVTPMKKKKVTPKKR